MYFWSYLVINIYNGLANGAMSIMTTHLMFSDTFTLLYKISMENIWRHPSQTVRRGYSACSKFSVDMRHPCTYFTLAVCKVFYTYIFYMCWFILVGAIGSLLGLLLGNSPECNVQIQMSMQNLWDDLIPHVDRPVIPTIGRPK